MSPGRREKDIKRQQPKCPADRHWLGEGWLGQESLIDEVDPYLLAADAWISAQINGICQDYDGDEERPVALLVPSDDHVSWYAGVLGEQFDLYLWASAEDSLIQRYVNYFNIERFSGSVPASIDGRVDCLLWIDSGWSSELEFVSTVRESVEYLSPTGTAYFYLRTTVVDGQELIYWADGSDSSLSRIKSGTIFGLDFPTRAYFRKVSALVEELNCGTTAFLKRHRRFFGKKVQDLLLSRLNAPDFSEVLRPEQSLEAVSVLGYARLAESGR